MENQQPIKSSKLNNIFKITGILGIIVASLSLLFYLAIFPYQKEQRKIEYEKRYNQAYNECMKEQFEKSDNPKLAFTAFTLEKKDALEYLIQVCIKQKLQ